MTLVDREWVCKYIPEKKILKMAVLLKVGDIGAFKYESDEFCLITIYFLGVDKHKQPEYTCIHHDMHLVDGLKANMLIRNNIIVPESIMIDLVNSIAFISSWNVRIAIIARQRG